MSQAPENSAPVAENLQILEEKFDFLTASEGKRIFADKLMLLECFLAEKLQKINVLLAEAERLLTEEHQFANVTKLLAADNEPSDASCIEKDQKAYQQNCNTSYFCLFTLLSKD